VLDNVERRRILVQPAGKHLVPCQCLIGGSPFLDKQLHECAHFGRPFPWQAALTSRQLDDDVADPARFAGLHHQILFKVVALVQQADGGHAVLDRRAEIAFHHRTARRARNKRFGHFGSARFCHFVSLPLAAGKRAQAKQSESSQFQDCGAFHAQASGDQAS
jgi:hypothetical protein